MKIIAKNVICVVSSCLMGAIFAAQQENNNNDDLERRYFGNHGANAAYPCFRDEYKWSNDRPAVPDSRIVTKENTVIHGLEADAKKFAEIGEKYQVSGMYQKAADYYTMAGDRRVQTIDTHPQLNDVAHANAIDYCYDKAREYEEKADNLKDPYS